MFRSKKFVVTLSFLAAIVLISATSLKQAKSAEEEKFKNLKVLPKNISKKQLDAVMENWEHSLGVRCGFCHVRNEETNKMDFALDGKPEKEMARKMYKMTADLNKKYFNAGKDSTGMVMQTGVNCNMCHNGSAHPKLKAPEAKRRPQGQRPQGPPANGQQSPTNTPPAQ